MPYHSKHMNVFILINVRQPAKCTICADEYEGFIQISILFFPFVTEGFKSANPLEYVDNAVDVFLNSNCGTIVCSFIFGILSLEKDVYFDGNGYDDVALSTNDIFKYANLAKGEKKINALELFQNY